MANGLLVQAMNTASDEEITLKLLKLLQKNPELTQREMNHKMGISLGKVNFCISALAQKGMIKIERFKKSENKSAYMYRLTPEGLEELADMTIRFLKLKIREYHRIKREIEALSEQIKAAGLDPGDEAMLLDDLK